MDWAWRFGMVVVSGVPAIVGGGITYGLTESWAAVIGWEILLVILLIVAIIKGGKSKTSEKHVLAQEAH
ncbi:MAG: hypothetical protein AAGU11_00070 [Syntrophobacteraceae bacterium]